MQCIIMKNTLIKLTLHDETKKRAHNKFFVSVVTLCDIFYSRFKRFFGLNVFLTK